MNLLKEGLEQRVVEKTTMTRKLTVDGLTKAYPVYKIRLDWLFYNDQNDRIATWISQYKAQHGGQAPDISRREEYNNIIEQFIVESNPDAIRKTQSNIEMVDQREAGVVLADGRIIDGNRRFTCLRRLSAKNPRFNYFEAVILDRNIESSAKQIKLLELSIQHGEESKVDYKSTRHFPACSHNFPKAGDARFQGRSRLFCLLGKFPYLDESRRILMAVSSKTSSKTRFTTPRRVASPPQPCSRPYGRSTRASS